MVVMVGSASLRFRANDDVLFQPVDNELVLLDLKSQRYYGLDDVGARIWQLLLELGSTDKVADRICEEYDADRDRVISDVEVMVEDFLAQGLVTQDMGTAKTGI